MAVKVIRDPRLTSGFVYESPLPGLPAVTHCGEAVTTSGHVMEPHSHLGFELMYACRGSYTWAVGRDHYLQQAGDIFVAFPGQLHRTASVTHPVCQQLWLGVRLDLLGSEGRSLATDLHRSRTHLIQGCPEIEPLLRGVVLQSVRAVEERNGVADAYLLTLVRLLGQRLSSDRDIGERVGVRHSYPILKALHLMRQNLSERLTLLDLAKAAGIGESQLCRRFRNEVGQSPAQHHRQLRLEAARDRLLVPGASILETAVSCGFSSSQHMSTVFQQTVGMTPKRWQQTGGYRAGGIVAAPGTDSSSSTDSTESTR